MKRLLFLFLPFVLSGCAERAGTPDAGDTLSGGAVSANSSGVGFFVAEYAPTGVVPRENVEGGVCSVQ